MARERLALFSDLANVSGAVPTATVLDDYDGESPGPIEVILSLNVTDGLGYTLARVRYYEVGDGYTLLGESSDSAGKFTVPTTFESGEHDILALLDVTENAQAYAYFHEVDVVEPDPPAFDSTPVQNAEAGTAYSYDVEASDPQGYDLTLTLEEAPASLTLTDNGDGTATLSGTPTTGESGFQTVSIKAASPYKSTLQTFTLGVSFVQFEDTFTEGSDTLLDLHTPDTDASGAGWTNDGDDLTVQASDNTLRGTANFARGTFDAETAYPAGTLNMERGGGTSLVGLYVRHQDVDNHIQVRFDTDDDEMFVRVRTGGSNSDQTPVAVTFPENTAFDADFSWDGETLTVECLGSTLTYDATGVHSAQTGAGVQLQNANSWIHSISIETSFVVVEGPLDIDAATTTTLGTGALSEQLVIPEGEVLEITGDVTTDYSVLVYGILRMHAGTSLQFTNVDESAFGGSTDASDATQDVGMAFNPDTDIGLWVLGKGAVDIQGTTVVPWVRSDGSGNADDPTWGVSDEILQSPYQSGDYGADGFDAVAKGSAVPSVTLSDGRDKEPVTLNLTRDVVIGGTSGGRAHVIFQGSTTASRITNARFEYLGPVKTGLASVPGRYPLHWHHCMSGSDGTVVTNVCVVHSGNRAFVPHASHGITMTGCVAYDVMGDAFWWDKVESAGNVTRGIVWDECVAAYIKPLNADPGYNLNGFMLGFVGDVATLGAGEGGTITDCIGVAVLGTKSSAPYQWPSFANSVSDASLAQSTNIWTFEGNEAFCCPRQGVRVWQNTSTDPHPVGIDVWHCGDAAIDHGAYGTPGYRYGAEGGTLPLYFVDCEVGFRQHAQSSNGSGGARADGYELSIEGAVFDGNDYNVQLVQHNLPTTVPSLYLDCTFANPGTANIRLDNDPNSNSFAQPGFYDFVNEGGGTDLAPADVSVGNNVAGSRLRIQQEDGTAWEIDADGNATSISAFYPDPTVD